MPDKDKIAYGIIALFSLALLFYLIPANMPPHPGFGVSAALMPNIAASIMLGLALMNLIRPSKKTAPAQDQEKSFGGILFHLTKFLVPCALVVPGMSLAGFFPAGLVFMSAIQLLCGQRNHVRNVLVSILTVGIMYMIMRYGFRVPLP